MSRVHVLAECTERCLRSALRASCYTAFPTYFVLGLLFFKAISHVFWCLQTRSWRRRGGTAGRPELELEAETAVGALGAGGPSSSEGGEDNARRYAALPQFCQ
jgi:hypothetical protein